ncbi:MAG: DUF6357 family protein [Leucobacter sp.]
MTDDSAASNPAEERVQQFMAEFDAQWRIAAPVFEERDPDNPRAAFDLWGELMAQTTLNHFTESPATNLAQSFSSPAEYGPDAERFVRSEILGDTAYVLTRTTSPLERFHEYTLRAQGADWRIAAIADHSGDPVQPFVDRATVEERVSRCASDPPFAEMPVEQAQLDEARNFAEREVRRGSGGEVDRARVSRIGTLVTGTGVLSVVDFGYDNDDARPLARTVEPGAYPVDRVTAFDRNAAVRVRFSEEEPVSWHPASLPGSGHVIGVDAGCVCIVDYVAYAEMTPREKAAAFDRFTEAPRPAVLEFSLGGADAGIACDSGYGDGSYPVYWGLDARGRVAQLVVDFMVLVSEGDDGALVHQWPSAEAPESAVEFARASGWIPRVLRRDGRLVLEVIGGADALHDPRTFVLPIGERHLAALRGSLPKHLTLWSALIPLCREAGTRDPLDARAAEELLDPVLLAPADEVDELLAGIAWDRALLVAHGADIELLDRGRIIEALACAGEQANWSRAEEDRANRNRASRGTTLSALDAAILRFTGQYLHGSTIPHRDPDAVDPALLPEVLRVVETAEQACADLRIARDARRGERGTDKRDWQRMEAAVDAAVRDAHPSLADDAVRTLRFLMCSEAADRAKRQPYDLDAASGNAPATVRERTLTCTDDQELEKTWNPGDDGTAIEAFWSFVAERYGSANEVFTLEDEALGDGIQLLFYADSIARVATANAGDGEAEPEYRVEYAVVDDLAHYRALVRAYVAGGFAALDDLVRWTADPAELERWRRQRADRGA